MIWGTFIVNSWSKRAPIEKGPNDQHKMLMQKQTKT